MIAVWAREKIDVGVLIIVGVMGQIGGWFFQAKHVRGVDNVSADEITR